MENELKSFAKERIWFLEQVRRKAEKSVTISNGGNFICRKVRGAFQYYLNGEYVKKSEKDLSHTVKIVLTSQMALRGSWVV